MTALAAFDRLILELTKRKRRWTSAERDLYEACVRSICRSALREKPTPI